ncbi:MAG: hypothetical protein V4568_14590 [Pseudomonadota bacterium]
MSKIKFLLSKMSFMEMTWGFCEIAAICGFVYSSFKGDVHDRSTCVAWMLLFGVLAQLCRIERKTETVIVVEEVKP